MDLDVGYDPRSMWTEMLGMAATLQTLIMERLYDEWQMKRDRLA